MISSLVSKYDAHLLSSIENAAKRYDEEEIVFYEDTPGVVHDEESGMAGGMGLQDHHSDLTPSVKIEDDKPEQSRAFVDEVDRLDNSAKGGEGVKFFRICACPILAIIVAAVIYVIIFFSSRDDRNSSGATTGPSLSFEPTLAPGPQIPTPSSPTDVAPPSERPQNDACVDAIGPLNADDSIMGTVAFSTKESVDTCGDVTSTEAGVWYYVLGTGGEMLAHTCLGTSFDTKITVFKGGCDKPICFESNDNFCGTQSAVSWMSTYQQEYRILVHGEAPNPTDASFQLTLIPRYNDECNTAIGPISINTPGLVLGDTAMGNPNNEIACGGATNNSPSVFYLVRGTGGTMNVNACQGTNFSPRVTILSGDCTDLQCVAQSAVCEISWTSTAFADYYVMIDGQDDDDSGNFGLKVTSSTVPDNSECSRALGPLQLDGSAVKGSTSAATVDSDAPFCLSAVSSPGVWFFVVGDGSTLQASLCNGATFDTRLSIYEGSCEEGAGLSDLLCIDGNDDFCGQESLVTWVSQPGETYYILVHGYQRGQGDFELTVTSLVGL